MKNFYEVMDFDTRGKLVVSIELIKHNNPVYYFTVNEMPIEQSAKFDLLDTLTFKCRVTEGAIEVAKIAINDKEVIPIYLHLAKPATNWITANWEFTIPGPFYPWYHEITGQGWIA